MSPRTRKAQWLAAAAGVLAVAAPLVLSGCASGPGPRQAAVIPAGTQKRLLALAEQMAKAVGDPDPEWLSVVASTHEKAVQSSSGDLAGGPAFPAYLITMKGHFTASDTTGPAGSKAPTGQYVTLVVDARTLQGTDFGIAPGPPPQPASSLGPVTYLKGP